MNNNKFIVEKEKEGNKWHWVLYGASDPRIGPIAKSGRTYNTPAGALKSILSAQGAMKTTRFYAPYRGKLVKYKVLSKYQIERAK